MAHRKESKKWRVGTGKPMNIGNTDDKPVIRKQRKAPDKFKPVVKENKTERKPQVWHNAWEQQADWDDELIS